MIGDILDFMDDMTGNVVSDFSRFHEKRQYQREMNKPCNRIALRKIYLVNRIKECNDTMERYKECDTLVELYSKWKKEAKDELELLR